MKRAMRIACTILAGALALGLPSTSAATPDPADTLSPGDAIRLEFWREPELDGEYSVDEDGAAVLPVIGVTEIAGIGDADLKRQLQERYLERLNNQHVQITTLRRVSVLGEVREPGLYHVDPTMSLADAVALAGGTTSNGQMAGIRVFRDGDLVLTSADWDAWVSASVRSGDEIFVPERSWFSRNGAFLIGATLTLAGIVVGATF